MTLPPTLPTPTSNPARSYHHGDLQATLKRLAVQHIAAVGTEGFSLRALARQAGVSPAAFYRHFPSRHHLLAAIATDGFEGLQAALQSRLAVVGPEPAARLFACGQGYVGYAVANPVHYHLMFGGVLGNFAEFTALLDAAERSYSHVLAALEDGLACGRFSGGTAEQLGGTIWSGVHGVASILIDKGSMAAGRPDSAAMRAVVALAEDVDGVLRRLLRAMTAQDPDPKPDPDPHPGPDPGAVTEP